VCLNAEKIRVRAYNNGCVIILYIFMILPYAFPAIKYDENTEIIDYIQLTAVAVQ